MPSPSSAAPSRSIPGGAASPPIETMTDLSTTRRHRPFRHLRRQLRERDADPCHQRAARRLRKVQGRPGVPGRVSLRTEALRGAALPHLSRGTHQPRNGRRADLPEARRPQSHRRAQGQQHHRPGDACQAHGQAPRDRGNRSRPAWRGHRHDLRALRTRMRGLHGQPGRQAPEPQRLPHEPAGRDGGAGRVGQQDPERRAQRGHARLGHQCRKHLLHHRHRRRTAPLPDHGARLPERDRQRVHCPDARHAGGAGHHRRGRGSAARRGGGLRGRRQQCDGHLPSVHSVPRTRG